MPLPQSFIAGPANVPEVVAKWTADITAATNNRQKDLVYRCAEAAIQCLAMAGVMRPLLDVIRSRRHKTRSHNEEFYVWIRRTDAS